MGWWPMVEQRPGRRLQGHGWWRRPVSGDPRQWAGQGRRLERHSVMGDPFGGSGEEGCSPVSPSMVAWVDVGRGRT
jgi:hypothetical protein